MTVTPARRPPASGDVRACLSDFLVANYARLIGRLRARLGCEDLASDSLHDAWLRLADGSAPEPGGAAGVVNPGAYLFRMACNIAIDRLRAEQLRRAGGPELEPDEVEDGAPGPQQIAQARSSLRDFLREVDTLPRQQRAVYIDVRIEGLPQSAAASRYGLSSRIVRHLRDAGRHMAGMRTGWPVRRRRARSETAARAGESVAADANPSYGVATIFVTRPPRAAGVAARHRPAPFESIRHAQESSARHSRPAGIHAGRGHGGAGHRRHRHGRTGPVHPFRSGPQAARRRSAAGAAHADRAAGSARDGRPIAWQADLSGYRYTRGTWALDDAAPTLDMTRLDAFERDATLRPQRWQSGEVRVTPARPVTLDGEWFGEPWQLKLSNGAAEVVLRRTGGGRYVVQ